ncbi:uncharacterized protein BJX67DRAFT_384905 [Aspergillus lucknowensis]|uniref:Nephrocystin 3-like N-terminal domain-containing protein n=1 Tax=Aspergillus lucknowensis TaxID=176173 RepID=A0ABR4LF38_9EURO
MAPSGRRRLSRESYTVALICSHMVELNAARGMLDEEHEKLPQDGRDRNVYVLGTLSRHNVVLASSPVKPKEKISTATVATNILYTFPAVTLLFSVGIAGGIPSTSHDIRLGDVVIGDPSGTSGSVVKYDFGKETLHGFQRKPGNICSAPPEFAAASTIMKHDHRIRHNRIKEFIGGLWQRHPHLGEYRKPLPETDVLFLPSYDHPHGQHTCKKCDRNQTVSRLSRGPSCQPQIFYGLIASGSRIVRDGGKRDKLAAECGGPVCLDTEAHGLQGLPSIIIRGIAHYCDAHTNNSWDGYAAAAAAAVAKEILTYIRPVGSIGESATGLLWVSADPFAGKSVLTRFLADDILRSPSRAVCYYFFREDWQSNLIARSMSCVLHQLFEQRPHLMSEALVGRFEADDDNNLYESFSELFKILFGIASRHHDEIVLLLDAVHILNGYGGQNLWDVLAEYHSTATPAPNLKILITSRPYAQVQRSFRVLENKYPSIHIRGADEAQGQRSQEKSRLHPPQSRQSRRQARPPSTTEPTSVMHVLDSLEESVTLTREGVRATINELPARVSDDYCLILNKCVDRARARLLFDLIVAARWALRLEELATAFEKVDTGKGGGVEPLHRFRHAIRNTCGLFVTVIDDRVHLTHPAARDFLVRKNERPYWVSDWGGCLAPGESERLFARACVEYLHSIDIDLCSENWDHFVSLVATLPFLQYSIQSWNYHLRRAEILKDEKDEKDKDGDEDSIHGYALDILRRDDDIGWFWYKNGMTDSHIRCLTPLMKASFLGLDRAVTTLLAEQGTDVNAVIPCGRSALSLAAENGHESTVRLLLSNRARHKCIFAKLFGRRHVDDPDSSGRTPLWYAAKEGHKPVVRLLLETGIRRVHPDRKDNESVTPLACATAGSHKDVVRLLLDTGRVNINSKEEYGRTPLVHAAQNGHADVVQLLLSRGALDMGSQDGRKASQEAFESTKIPSAGVKEVDSDTDDERTVVSESFGRRSVNMGAINRSTVEYEQTPLDLAVSTVL